MKPKAFLIYFLSMLAGCILSGIAVARAQDSGKNTRKQVDALLEEKSNRTPAERKIDSQLLQAIKEAGGQKMAEGTQLERADVRREKNGLVMVDIDAVITDDFLEKIKQMGGEIVFPSKQYKTVRAKVPLSVIKKIAAFDQVKFIKAASLPILSGGAASSQAIRH